MQTAAQLQAARDSQKSGGDNVAKLKARAAAFSRELSTALGELQTCRRGKQAAAASAVGGAAAAVKAAVEKVSAVASTASGAGLASAAVGLRAYFRVQAALGGGAPASAAVGDPFWWARLVGSHAGTPTYTPVAIRDVGSGVYEGSFVAWEAGLYLLEVSRLGKPIKGSPFKVVARCCAGVGAAFVPGTGDGSASEERYTQELERCAPTGGGAPCVAPAAAAPVGAGFRWVGDEWLAFTRSGAAAAAQQQQQCLTKRGIGHILFVGDSLQRCTFWAMGAFLRGETIKTHYTGYDAFYSLLPKAGGVRLSYQQAMGSAMAVGYIHLDDKHKYLDGTQAAQLETWFDIRGAHAHTKNKQEQLPPSAALPDAVVLSAAAHDMIVDDVEAYKRNIATVMWKLRVQWKFAGPVIWVGGSSPVPKLIAKNFPHYAYRQTFAKVREFDEAARSVTQEWGVPFISVADLTATRPETSFDGQHYVSGADPLKDPVYVAIAKKLLGDLCSADASANTGA